MDNPGHKKHWFKVKPDCKPPKPAIAKPTLTTTSSGTKEIQPSTAPATRHTHKKPIDKPPTTLAHSASTSTGIPNSKNTPTTTGDYCIKEGHQWKRVHQQEVRTDLCTPQQTYDGPDVTQLRPDTITSVAPTNGSGPYSMDGNWATKTKATLNIPWTGSTDFEEQVSYKDEYYTIEEDEQRRAVTAKKPKNPFSQPRKNGRTQSYTPTL